WLVIDGHWLEVGTWREGRRIEGWGLGGGCLSGDGKLLARYGGESANEWGITLFDRRSGRRLGRLGIPGQGRVYCMTFNGDGTQLIGTDMDKLVIHVWDLPKLRAELKELGLDWDLPPYPAVPAVGPAA